MDISVNLDKYYLKSTVRNDLIALMPEKVSTVLEVGCGIGKTGKAIVQRKNANVVGIDISEEAIAYANQLNCYQKLLVCNLDESPVPQEIEQERFDCILYPDVLEHLKYPWKLLESHVHLLNDNGCMLASIPNIRHYSTIYHLLLKGEWSYQDMGIMDRSHLRFFTKKTIIDLFDKDSLQLTFIKPRCLSGSKLVRTLNKLLFNCLEDFLTTQYLICVKKIS